LSEKLKEHAMPCYRKLRLRVKPPRAETRHPGGTNRFHR
jgi:hypothetical protein